MASLNTLVVDDPILDLPHPATPGMSENLAFFGYDERRGIAYWSHLGRLVPDSSVWEAIFTVLMPDGNVLSHRSLGTSAIEPASAQLRYELVEPLQRWRIRLSGVAQRLPRAAATRRPVALSHLPGEARGDFYESLEVDIEFAGTSPVWNTGGHDWGKLHIHQMGRASGTITSRGDTVPVEFAGGRDHTRGPRNLATLLTEWWGVATFPSGRAIDIIQTETREGGRWSSGVVWDGSTMLPVSTAATAPLDDVAGSPRTFELELTGACAPSLLSCATLDPFPYTLIRPTGILPGLDPIDPETLILVEAPARFEWDGESCFGWMERCRPVGELGGAGPSAIPVS